MKCERRIEQHGRGMERMRQKQVLKSVSVVGVGLAFLLAGCATGPASSSPSPSTSSTKPSGGAPVCHALPTPSWVRQSAPLQAVGRSTVSQEDADKNARVELIKTLEVKIDGADRISQQETSDKGFSYDISSDVVETVQITISGLDVLQRHADPCGPQYYALARLDREQAVKAWGVDIVALAERHAELSRHAVSWQEQGDVLRALEAWSQVLEVDATAEQLERRRRYLAQQTADGASTATRLEQTNQRLTTVLSSLRLVKASGDRQRAKPGKPLGDPLAVLVLSTMGGHERPVAEIPIAFSFEGGQGEIESLLRTNTSGLVEGHVRRVEASDASAVVLANVATDQLGIALPRKIQDRLTQHVNGQAVRFSVTPPPVFGQASPLGNALHDLALRLAANVNDSQGGRTVMRDFVENRSKRHFGLSGRLESGLQNALVRVDALRFLDLGSNGAIPVQQEGTKSAFVAELFGVYEIDPSGSLWMMAKLVRTGDHVMEATAEGTIPRSALAEEDLLEIGQQRMDKAVPILSVPGPSQSLNEWVEGFWDLRNANGFKTELLPERVQYHNGQAASFRFRTTQDCYLTVVNVGASGSWNVLLPNAWRPSTNHTLVRASDGWVTIPSQAEDFQFTVSRPFGTERVKAICTVKPFALVERMDLSQKLFQLPADGSSRLRDLTVSAVSVQPEGWSEAHAAFVTLDTAQTETKGLRGLKSRGLVSK